MSGRHFGLVDCRLASINDRRSEERPESRTLLIRPIYDHDRCFRFYSLFFHAAHHFEGTEDLESRAGQINVFTFFFSVLVIHSRLLKDEERMLSCTGKT